MKISIIIFFVCFSLTTLAQDESINTAIFNSSEDNGKWIMYKNINNSLYEYLAKEAIGQLEKRELKLAKIKTKDQMLEYITETQKKLQASVGHFPSNTPLNAKITGKIDLPYARIEKIVFESIPGFYVTGALFLPKKMKKKAPAILYLSGHSELAFRSETYQQVIHNLVYKGYIVFAIDPVGQGERLEYHACDSLPFQDCRSTVLAHSYPGIQCFLAGNSLLKYMIGDGMRAIDYLMTRKEVDTNRIAATGRSGGGTQAAWLAAFEGRIKAVAIENYITSGKRLVQSIGLQDAEQVLVGGFKKGIDFADLIHVRAPRPTMIIATTNDFFNIQGAIETYQEAEKTFEILDKPGQIKFQSDIAGHASTKANREALYSFFNQTLAHEADSMDRDFEFLSPESLQILPSDWNYAETKTVFSLNQAFFKQAFDTIEYEPLTTSGLSSLLDLNLDGKIKAVQTGAIEIGKGNVEKHFLEEGYPLPVLIFEPHETSGKTLLYLSSQGKASINNPEMQQLMKEGFRLIIPDLSGTGELGGVDSNGNSDALIPQGVSPNLWFLANQVEKSILTIRVEELIKLWNYCRSEIGDRSSYYIWADGEMAPVALHANPFFTGDNKLLLSNSITSYHDIIYQKYYDPYWINSTFPSAIYHYDLSSLIQLNQEVNMLLLNPVNQLNQPVKEGGWPLVETYYNLSKEEIFKKALLWMER